MLETQAHVIVNIQARMLQDGMTFLADGIWRMINAVSYEMLWDEPLVRVGYDGGYGSEGFYADDSVYVIATHTEECGGDICYLADLDKFGVKAANFLHGKQNR